MTMFSTLFNNYPLVIQMFPVLVCIISKSSAAELLYVGPLIERYCQQISIFVAGSYLYTYQPFPSYNKTVAGNFENIYLKIWKNPINESKTLEKN